MKKILFRIFAALILALPLCAGVSQVTFAQEDCSGFGLACYVKGFKLPRADNDPDAKLLDVLKKAINWILGMLATIALIICMYAGFKVLTSGGDSKGYDAGIKMLKNAALGLALIGISWLIVSAVLWFIGIMTDDDTMSSPSNSQHVEKTL